MFGKQNRSEADLCIQATVLGDPGYAAKFTDRTRKHSNKKLHLHRCVSFFIK